MHASSDMVEYLSVGGKCGSLEWHDAEGAFPAPQGTTTTTVLKDSLGFDSLAGIRRVAT